MELTRDRLAERIARSQPQLVLLVAPSGFGKTVLTQQIAEQCDVRVLDLGSGPPAGAAGSIVRLLSAAPQNATVVVACRRPLSFPASKVAPPHRILTLRATDLAFDEDEIARLFAPFDLSNDDLATVAHTTCGWPIGALLLRRFAEEGRLAHLLTRPDDPAFDELYAYLVDEVLAPLSPAEQRAVLCCAAIEGPTAQDVAAALGSDLAFDGILDAAPFIERRSDGVYALHSLLQHAVRRRFDGSCAALAVAAARAHENAQRYLRAAQIYRNAGLLDDMARAVFSD